MLNIQENINKVERELKLRNYSPKTIKAYSICIKYFLEKLNKNPDNINKTEIEDFLLFYIKIKKNLQHYTL